MSAAGKLLFTTRFNINTKIPIHLIHNSEYTRVNEGGMTFVVVDLTHLNQLILLFIRRTNNSIVCSEYSKRVARMKCTITIFLDSLVVFSACNVDLSLKLLLSWKCSNH